MIRQSYTAVVERNQVWSGSCASEPYEAAWASEAIFFLRTLETAGLPPVAEVQVQISPDGMNWCDEGTQMAFPKETEAVTFCRVRHFGNWLRLAGKLPESARVKVIVYLVLKE